MMMAARLEIEDQASVTNVDNGEILDSPGSDEADSAFVRVGVPLNAGGDGGLISIGEGNAEYDVIKTCFLSGLGPAAANETTIVSVYKNSTAGITTRAKFLAFRVFMDAVARKNGGDANVKYGWYAGSKEEIGGIVSHGFSGREIEKLANDAGSHGVGIHLVPSKFSLAGALATEPDEEGLRHLLLCRIILGKSELLRSGSKQSYPSSIEFDSGVDDLQNPRKYVIWSCSMNSHILPSYIISFRSPRLRGLSRDWSFSKPNSPWVSFPALISMLSKSLERTRMNVILKSYIDFRKGHLRRDQLVQRMREVAGDNLLAEIIKNCRDKDRDRT